MSSKKNRLVNSWLDHPVKCFFKALLHMIHREQYDRYCHRGNDLELEIVFCFKSLVPFYQDYFKHPVSDKAIYDRSNRRRTKHAESENVYANPKTQPYCALAAKTLEQYYGVGEVDKEDLEQEVNKIVAELPTQVARTKTLIKQSVKDEHYRVVSRLGGRCPCCGLIPIAEAGVKLAGTAEVDHFWHVHEVTFARTWPLCVACHRSLATQEAREAALEDFKSYQRKAKRVLAELQKKAAA
jgi:hypothetical protein